MENKEQDVDKNIGAGKCFLMIEPRGMRNSGAIARRIARCEGVREVHLTSGRYGFVVAANTSADKGADEISSAVKKVSGARNMNVAVSHMVYR